MGVEQDGAYPISEPVQFVCEYYDLENAWKLAQGITPEFQRTHPRFTDFIQGVVLLIDYHEKREIDTGSFEKAIVMTLETLCMGLSIEEAELLDKEHSIREKRRVSRADGDCVLESNGSGLPVESYPIKRDIGTESFPIPISRSWMTDEEYRRRINGDVTYKLAKELRLPTGELFYNRENNISFGPQEKNKNKAA
jgi:hypothetical protein